MTREQMMAYRKQLVDHLEQCRELVKPRERFFKKYHSRLFWSLQRDLNLRVRAENGLVVGILLWMLALMVLYFVRGQMRMTASEIFLFFVAVFIGEIILVVGPTSAGVQVSAMEAQDARNGWSLEIADQLPGVHKMCYTEKGLNKLISYIKSGRANSLEDASQLYVDGVLRKYNWLLRGLDGLRNS